MWDITAGLSRTSCHTYDVEFPVRPPGGFPEACALGIEFQLSSSLNRQAKQSFEIYNLSRTFIGYNIRQGDPLGLALMQCDAFRPITILYFPFVLRAAILPVRGPLHLRRGTSPLVGEEGGNNRDTMPNSSFSQPAPGKKKWVLCPRMGMGRLTAFRGR